MQLHETTTAELKIITRNYMKQLAQQQSNHICEQPKGALSMEKTWALLRHLLNPLKNKPDQFHPIQELIHKSPSSTQNLINQIRKICVLEGEQTTLPNYHGPENTLLVADITEAEVRSATQNVRPGSATGLDANSNKMRRNLDDPSTADLTAYYKHYRVD